MSRLARHTTALLIIAVVGLLPLSTLLHSPIGQDASPAQALLAPAAPADGTPAEDPTSGQVWAPQAQLGTLWPPSAEPPRLQREAFRHPGHLRRIDRPPRG